MRYIPDVRGGEVGDGTPGGCLKSHSLIHKGNTKVDALRMVQMETGSRGGYLKKDRIYCLCYIIVCEWMNVLLLRNLYWRNLYPVFTVTESQFTLSNICRQTIRRHIIGPKRLLKEYDLLSDSESDYAKSIPLPRPLVDYVLYKNKYSVIDIDDLEPG